MTRPITATHNAVPASMGSARHKRSADSKAMPTATMASTSALAKPPSTSIFQVPKA